MNDSINERTQFLITILHKLENIALSYFRTNSIGIQNKAGVAGFDPVTLADREIEHCFRDALAVAFPTDSVLGEEFENRSTNSPYQWIIDPIDGTRAFVIGSPSFTILIALEYEGEPVLGVISQPFTGERFWGENGKARWERLDKNLEILVSNCTQINLALLASTFPEVGTNEERLAFERVRDQVKLTRYGMDGYAYALLAAGHIDLVVEASLKPFDYAAPRAVIKAAGGVFCGWDGNEVTNGRVLAAATPELAAQAIKLLQAY